MARTQTLDRLVDGVEGNNSALYDGLRAANDRMYRFNRMFLDEAERTQRERAEIVRQWLGSPADIASLNRIVFETWTRRLRRRMELARTAVDDLRDMGASNRSIWERFRENNRETASATAQVGREVAADTAEEIAERTENLGDAVNGTARRMRRQARKADLN